MTVTDHSLILAPNAAIEGQRPGTKPAQGNALGTASNNGEALKGRDQIVRGLLGRPFRAWSSFLSFPGRCPGLACFCTFGAQSRHPVSPTPQRRGSSWRLALTLACSLFAALALGASAAEPSAKAAGHKSLRTMSWGDKLKEAGVVGVVQLGMSAFGAIFIFERLFGLRRKNLVPPGLTARAKKMWQESKFDDLEKLGNTEPSTQARVISFIAQNRKSPMAEVSEVAGDLVSRELAMHHQRAYPLGIVATLAPLLGLLGMIFGMITTFETVAMAGALGDPTQLASGISEALVTTGLGLAVAIPFLALYHFFKYRTNGYGVLLEGEVTSLLTAWFMNREAR